MTMTSLWRNVSVNVVANSKWSCLLISAPKVRWRVQPSAARWSGRFNKILGVLRALHMSLNNACMRIVRKWLKMNNGHIITFRIEWNGDIMSAERRTKLFWNHHPKPTTVSELKVALQKIWDSFPQVQLTKLSGVLQPVWLEYVNGDGRYSKHLSLLKECSHFTAFTLYWIVETIFDNVTTATVPWLKAM